MDNPDPWSTLRPHQLRDLIAVVETGSLRAAARRLGLTQPSLTKSLRQLESQLEIPLLLRSTHGVTLTSAGERLLEHARTIESQIRRAAEDLAQLRGGTSGRVSVGVSPAVSLGFFAEAVDGLRARHRDAVVRITEGLHERLLADVRQGTIDFALMPREERDLLLDLRVRPLFQARVVVMGRKGHPCGNARGLADLAGCDWITQRRNSTLDQLIEREAARLGLNQLRWKVECASSLIYRDIIARSDLIGLALATRPAGAPVRAEGVTSILDGPPLPVVSVVLVHRPDLPPTGSAGMLASLCRKSVARLIRPATRLRGHQALR